MLFLFGLSDAFGGGETVESRKNLLIGGDDVAQIAAEEVLVQMLDAAAVSLRSHSLQVSGVISSARRIVPSDVVPSSILKSTSWTSMAEKMSRSA